VAAPRIGDLAEEVDVEGDRAGDPDDREVARDVAGATTPVDIGAAEGGRRVVFHVEEVG